MDDRLKSALSGVLRKGKNQLIKHLKGEKVSRANAVYAKCYDCNGLGEQDECDDKGCALWPYSQFTKNARNGTFTP